MAPPGIKDKLPLLNQLIRWFLDPGVVADSPVFKLHHQVIFRSWKIFLTHPV